MTNTVLGRPVFPALLIRRRMSEGQFQQWVADVADLYGWHWHHETDSRKSKAGFLDLTLWHPGKGRIIFAELKTEKGQPTPEQRQTLVELSETAANAVCLAHDADAVHTPIQAFLWRPSMMERIEEILR